jgi:hypothetical protein
MPAINTPVRTTVRNASTTLAVVGWSAVAALGIDLGAAAGVNTWWLAACSVAIAFTMVAGQWWMLPTQSEREEQATVYAMGVERGLGCGACPLRPEPGSRRSEPTRPTLVR